MRSAVLASVLLYAILAAGCGAVHGTPFPPSAAKANLPPCTWAKVTRIVDGDTVHVLIGGRDESVRYIGIDTPELKSGQTPAAAYADEATTFNRDLVLNVDVCLERDVSDRDRFGRLLRYVWLADGRMVNEELLAAGLAVVATFPPDVKYIEPRFLTLQHQAREAGLGVWSEE